MKFFRKVFLISLLILLLFNACNSNTPSAPNIPKPEVPENHPEPPQPELPTESEPEQEPEESSESSTNEFLSCPVSGENLTLGFDHALTVDQEGVNLTHFLKQGYLTLTAGDVEEDGTVNLSSLDTQMLNYEMIGVMDVCGVEVTGTMEASASGTCKDGVVYLTIVETWLPGSGQITCEDGAASFTAPGPGAFVHEGPDGSGEVFYLVEDSAGYTVMREFAMGSGYHTWTLYASLIELAPLVP